MKYIVMMAAYNKDDSPEQYEAVHPFPIEAPSVEAVKQTVVRGLHNQGMFARYVEVEENECESEA